MRLLFGILIAFLMLSIGSSAIVFLYDHLSVLPIWDSQIWKTWKTPIIIIAVIAGLALLVVASSRSSKKAARAEKEFALAQGWGYIVSSNDTEEVIPKIAAVLEKVSPEKEFDVRTVMTAPHGKGDIVMFGCWYSGRSASNYKLGSACLIESDRLRGMSSQVDIVPRTGIDSALMFRQVDMGDSEFSRSYIVASRDDFEAIKTINESMKAVLVEYKNSPDFIGNFEITLGPGGAVILRWAQVLPEEWPTILNLARRLESAIK